MPECERERGRRCILLVEEVRKRFDGVEGLSGEYPDASEPPKTQSNNGTSECVGVDDMPPDVGYCVTSAWVEICDRTRTGSSTRSTIARGRVRGRPLEKLEKEELRNRALIFEPGWRGSAGPVVPL